jgi:hypothetical protein
LGEVEQQGKGDFWSLRQQGGGQGQAVPGCQLQNVPEPDHTVLKEGEIGPYSLNQNSQNSAVPSSSRAGRPNSQEQAEFVTVQWQRCWLSLLGQTAKESKPYSQRKSSVNGCNKFLSLTAVNYSSESP